MDPASIRSKNPGAMWGHSGRRTTLDKFVPTTNPIALKYHSTQTEYLNDGLGQGNNIAYFPTFVDGICAQIDLWRTPKYYNKRFEDAITIWSGGNNVESYMDFVEARVPGITPDTIMGDTFWRGPMAIPFLKAQARHEAGRKYPAPVADWETAHQKIFGLTSRQKVIQEIRNFQAANGLLADGDVGPATWALIKTKMGIAS